jgi:hypothetical protein
MATICVWLPTFKRPQGGVPKSGDEAVQKALSAIENVGHAAMSLDDGTYMSWWPSEAVSPDTDFSSVSFRVHSLEDDLRAEGAKPSLEEKIGGLHEDVIRSWWVRVAEKGFAIPFTLENNPASNFFSLWRTNCSNIVALALRLGGGDKIVPIPRFDMYTPFHIYAWAKAAGAIQGIKSNKRGR